MALPALRGEENSPPPPLHTHPPRASTRRPLASRPPPLLSCASALCPAPLAHAEPPPSAVVRSAAPGVGFSLPRLEVVGALARNGAMGEGTRRGRRAKARPSQTQRWGRR